MRLAAPLRAASNVTNGFLGSAIYRTFGGAPAPLVKWAFQLTSIDKYLTKPLAIATHLDDREFLAQIEAVDHFMAHMHAYPGRTMGQLYHRFFRVNDLADGTLDFDDGEGEIELADVRVPVMAVAGANDVLAPRAAVHHLASLLPNAPEVRIETAPGGHLGVLTGRSAATHDVGLDRRVLRRHGGHGRARRPAAAARRGLGTAPWRDGTAKPARSIS